MLLQVEPRSSNAWGGTTYPPTPDVSFNVTSTGRAIYFVTFLPSFVAISWAFEYRANTGRRYLYAVEKRRTPKGPRNTRCVYLGTAETLLKRLASPDKPLRSFEFGKMGRWSTSPMRPASSRPSVDMPPEGSSMATPSRTCSSSRQSPAGSDP